MARRASRVAVLVAISLAISLASGGLARTARAIEAFDGALQIHGFWEAQIRTIGNDYEITDGFTLTQFYNVLNVEIEADLLQDPIGPLDYLSAFVRIEARYDCVWDSCFLFQSSINQFGDDVKQLPQRLSDARSSGFDGTMFTGDTRPRLRREFARLDFLFRDVPVADQRQPGNIWHVPGITTLFGVEGPDGIAGFPGKPGDDPAFYTFERFSAPGGNSEDRYQFALRSISGPTNGVGTQILPWRPVDRIEPIAALADRANPFRSEDVSLSVVIPDRNGDGDPDLTVGPGTRGSGELPFRPAPERSPGMRDINDPTPRGIFIPNHAVASMLRNDEFGPFDQNFRQAELEWNRGASQQDEKELKEAYLDIELFDARLWLRVGKQSIVWGKTELFRTTDQFNPQDLALGSLVSLEESRISLWAFRAVWSFGSIGFIEDLRLEAAMNFDQFEPADLGRCGEPYTPNPVCDKTAGLWAHGLTGFGLAGEVRPDDPWEDGHGIEWGVRLEWRSGAFSFALTNFQGFEDTPYIDRVFTYSRNVDPITGRPRHTDTDFRCEGPGSDENRGCLDADDALTRHSVNQQLFAMICSSSVGFTELDVSSCAQSVFNSMTAVADNPLDPGRPLNPADAFGIALAGSGFATVVYNTLAGLPFGFPAPLIPLNNDSLDLGEPDEMVACNFAPGDAVGVLFGEACISEFVTAEQAALFGCGPFYGTNCDVDGIDLMNAELSALSIAFPGTPGTFFFWDTFDDSVAQPGTVGFADTAACHRFERGRSFVLPGCRGPGDKGYDPDVDGVPVFSESTPQLLTAVNTTLANLRGLGASDCENVAGGDRLIHPFTCQLWRSELAASSWNYLMVLVALSGLGVADAERTETQFKPSEPFRTGACSFREPWRCSNVTAIFSVAGVTRNAIRAGGNGRFGRTDFSWHSGGSGVLRYQKRNVLGFSMDFAEDISKTNWSMEFTWFNNVLFTDNNQPSSLGEADSFNLTVSVDRPTFINFLNANRTIFFNSQWFVRYLAGYQQGFTTNGPWSVLGTFTVTTGYFQDRLLPGVTAVYDFQSNSGALLPSVTWRYTADFSIQIGLAAFWGRTEAKDAPLFGVGSNPNRVGEGANNAFVDNALSPVRDRDEIFMRVRYNF